MKRRELITVLGAAAAVAVTWITIFVPMRRELPEAMRSVGKHDSCDDGHGTPFEMVQLSHSSVERMRWSHPAPIGEGEVL